MADATWNSATDVPVTAASYTATGNTVPSTGLFKLRIGIQKSTDLLNFTPFPMTSPQTTISGDGKLEFEFASPDNAAFYRLLHGLETPVYAVSDEEVFRRMREADEDPSVMISFDELVSGLRPRGR